MNERVRITPGQMQMRHGVFLKYIKEKLTEPGRKAIDRVVKNRPESLGDSKYRIEIPEDYPIRFTSGHPSVAKGLRPEIFGNITFPGDKWVFSESSIHLKIWSKNINHTFWAPTDSEDARRKFEVDEEARLILRLRFDLHEKKDGESRAHHPWYHLQFGGKSEVEHLDPRSVAPEGHYRYPPSLDIPRLPVFPMSFILMGRFVLANFHPFYYKELIDDKEDGEWRSLLRKEEKDLWKDYVREYTQFLDSDLCDESVFDSTGMDSTRGWPNT